MYYKKTSIYGKCKPNTNIFYYFHIAAWIPTTSSSFILYCYMNKNVSQRNIAIAALAQGKPLHKHIMRSSISKATGWSDLHFCMSKNFYGPGIKFSLINVHEASNFNEFIKILWLRLMEFYTNYTCCFIRKCPKHGPNLTNSRLFNNASVADII